eukprot:jgi/Ulvmu1/5156/UM021_0173.1
MQCHSVTITSFLVVDCCTDFIITHPTYRQFSTMVTAAASSRHALPRIAGSKVTCCRNVVRMAVQELPALQGPTLGKKYHGPHRVAEEGVERIVEMLRAGDMFRYGGNDEGSLQTSYAESEFAAYTGHKYCVGLNSCGSAIWLALWAAGVKEGDTVLSNALTFNAVPSAIYHARANGVFVESEDDHTMDLNDMECKIKAHPEAKFMLVSHMRGKLCDMDRVREMCDAHGITMVEDCAHSVGVFWGEKHTGHHGIAACFSTQSHKAINSGEGGFMCTDDEEIAAKVIVAAGGYEKFFMSHITAPGADVFERIQPMSIPNYSVRMSALTAATIRPQIKELPDRIAHANDCYQLICNRLMVGAAEVGASISIPSQHPMVKQHKDSIQFNLVGYSWEQVLAYLEDVKSRGVPVAVFGTPGGGLARDFRSWRYMYEDGIPPAMEKTESVIEYCVDLRLPPAFQLEDFEVVSDCLLEGFKAMGPPPTLDRSLN